MTTGKSFKRKVRERMTRTGENYTTALAALRKEQALAASLGTISEKMDVDPKGEMVTLPKGCIVCGQNPCIRETEMCGPCTFGEADTAGGNW
jgi:hypothetical protein